MLLGLAIAAVMGIALYFVTSLWVAIVVFTLMGFEHHVVCPRAAGIFGDNVPYAQRGRVMAIAEIAWSLAAIVGLPLVGILVQTQGWRIGFVAIGVFALWSFALLWFALPHEKRNAEHAAARDRRFVSRSTARTDGIGSHSTIVFAWRRRTKISISFLARG